MSTVAIRALIIDAGNTKVRVAGWCGGLQDPRQIGHNTIGKTSVPAELVDLGVVPTPTAGGGRGFLTAMAEIRDQYAEIPLVLTSVVPLVVELLQQKWPDIEVIDHRWNLPFKFALPHPETVGTDRLCNVAAAAVAGWRQALIVDAGTATTFDLLVGGEFVGGLIAPGMALAADCLGKFAARLTPVPFVPCALEPGRDTAEAMQAGAFHVGLGGVEAVITALGAKYGPLPVVVTGGLGGLLGQTDRLLDPDWTMRGAAVLAEEKIFA